jgi:phospholipid transport system substrate-binding protein
MIMKKFFALLLMLVLPALALADGADPQAVVQAAVTKLTARLQAEKPHLKGNNELLYSIINENITPYVDVDGIAKGVMGNFYRQANDAQKAKFAATFKDSLIRTYANGLAAYNNQKIDFLPFRASDKPNFAQVEVNVTGDNGAVYPITFQMKKSAQGEWKTQNLIVNGINLGLTFRNQFAQAVNDNNNNLDKAIAGWAPDAKAIAKQDGKQDGKH